MLTQADDISILRMLDFRDGDGLSGSEIADRLGGSRSSVIGKMNRVDNAEQPCVCQKVDNLDGSMPRRWWK